MTQANPTNVADREPSLPTSRSKFTMGRFMQAIALVGVLLALLRTPVGPMLLLGVITALVVGGLALVVARLTGMTKVRAAAWVCAGYPWLLVLALHTTWLTLRFLLGDPLRSPSSLPPAINTLVGLIAPVPVFLLMLAPVVLVAGAALIFTEAMLTVERNAPGRPNDVSRLILIPLALWLTAFLLLACELRWWGR